MNVPVKASLMLLGCLVFTTPALAQQRFPQNPGPALAPAPQAPAPPLSDDETVVFWEYGNQMGDFLLNMNERSGSARYRWFDGSVYNDQLRLQGVINITEPESRTGLCRCTLWKVPGEDFRLAFGTTGYQASDRPGQVLYRLYYSWDGFNFYRWKTNSGTGRSVSAVR
jgi:hypothetical protein